MGFPVFQFAPIATCLSLATTENSLALSPLLPPIRHLFIHVSKILQEPSLLKPKQSQLFLCMSVPVLLDAAPQNCLTTHCWAEGRTTLSLLVVFFLIQLTMLLVFATKVHQWLTLHLLPSRSPRSFSAQQHPRGSAHTGTGVWDHSFQGAGLCISLH